MRVVSVCPSYPPQAMTCGVGDYTRCLADELARQGVELLVLCSAAYRGPTDGPVRVLPVFPAWAFRDALRLALSPAIPKGDILHLQYTPELYGRRAAVALVPLLVRCSRVAPATVVTFHTLTGPAPWSRLAALLLLAAATRSISANEEVTAMVRRRAPRLAGRLVEIPIGANIPAPLPEAMDREAGRRLLGLPKGDPLLAHFGLVYPGKGLETLLAALAALRQSEPRARLAIVGDTPPQCLPYRRTLEALAARLGVAPAVIFTGRRPAEEVSAVLQAADLFVVPYDDGASIRRGSLLAGLAHGLPVVSTTPTVPSAYLADGDTVALVPPRDAAALAARLSALLLRSDEAARLGRAARRLAERFRWPVIARDTRALYAGLLDGR